MPGKAQPVGLVEGGVCGQPQSSHLLICTHCPVKTSSLWNWCSHDFGHGPSAWSQMWFMNLVGFALTVHFSSRNHAFISQLWASASFLACNRHAGAHFDEHCNKFLSLLFFAKSFAFNFNGIVRRPFVPWSFKNSPAYLKACNSTLDIYFSSQGPHLL